MTLIIVIPAIIISYMNVGGCGGNVVGVCLSLKTIGIVMYGLSWVYVFSIVLVRSLKNK